MLIEHEMSKPRACALDPTTGYLFFTKWGRSPPMLERTDMDGTGRKQLVIHKIVYPYGVSLDVPNKHVYWVDTYLDYVERIDYEGHNRRTIMRGSPVQNLYGISTFESSMFVSSWHSDSILELRKGKEEAKQVVQNITRPFNLHVFHRQKQPEPHGQLKRLPTDPS